MYTTAEDVQHMIGAAVKIYDESNLQRFIDNAANKRVHQLFEKVHEKALTDTYNDLYQMFWQPAVKGKYLGGTEDQINNMIGKLAEPQDFAQHVTHKISQSPKFTARVTHLVEQLAEITVTRETKFHDRYIKQEPDKDQNNLPSHLTGRCKDSCKTSEDEKTIISSQAQIHRGFLPVRKTILVKEVRKTIRTILLTCVPAE